MESMWKASESQLLSKVKLFSFYFQMFPVLEKGKEQQVLKYALRGVFVFFSTFSKKGRRTAPWHTGLESGVSGLFLLRFRNTDSFATLGKTRALRTE